MVDCTTSGSIGRQWAQCPHCRVTMLQTRLAGHLISRCPALRATSAGRPGSLAVSSRTAVSHPVNRPAAAPHRSTHASARSDVVFRPAGGGSFSERYEAMRRRTEDELRGFRRPGRPPKTLTAPAPWDSGSVSDGRFEGGAFEDEGVAFPPGWTPVALPEGEQRERERACAERIACAQRERMGRR